MAAFYARDFRREWLPIRPHRTIFKKLLFPDRHRALQSVNQPAACVERCASMRGSHYDENAGFTYSYVPESMHNAHFPDSKLLQCTFAKTFHFLQRHRFVSFILEI